VRQAKQILPEGNVETGSKRAPLIFLMVVTGYLMIAWADAMMIDMTSDKIFPVTVASVTLVCCFALLIRMIRAPESDAAFADRELGDDGVADHGLWPTLAWFLGLLVLSSLLGFIIALALFFVAFFKLRARLHWPKALALSAAGIAFICAMAWTLNRDFPPGLLQAFVKLPWSFT